MCRRVLGRCVDDNQCPQKGERFVVRYVSLSLEINPERDPDVQDSQRVAANVSQE